MDLLDLALLPARPFKATIRESLPPRDVTSIGEEAPPAAVAFVPALAPFTRSRIVLPAAMGVTPSSV